MRNFDAYFMRAEQNFEQTLVWVVIWDAMRLMWYVIAVRISYFSAFQFCAISTDSDLHRSQTIDQWPVIAAISREYIFS